MSGDRKQTLDLFKYNGGVLVAIKCLDEVLIYLICQMR